MAGLHTKFNSYSAGQEILGFMEPDISLPAHRRAPLDRILSHINPVHILTSYFVKTNHNIMSHPLLSLISGLFRWGFPTRIFMHYLSLGVKLPGREADHSPPSSSEVKNACNYVSPPPIRLHGVVLS